MDSSYARGRLCSLFSLGSVSTVQLGACLFYETCYGCDLRSCTMAYYNLSYRLAFRYVSVSSRYYGLYKSSLCRSSSEWISLRLWVVSIDMQNGFTYNIVY